jgi:hypothetical protein
MLPMNECATCGNRYDKAFKITLGAEEFYFDSFECAIQRLATTCENCQCRIIGHGVEGSGKMYCCAHCAEKQGAGPFQDRIE